MYLRYCPPLWPSLSHFDECFLGSVIMVVKFAVIFSYTSDFSWRLQHVPHLSEELLQHVTLEHMTYTVMLSWCTGKLRRWVALLRVAFFLYGIPPFLSLEYFLLVRKQAIKSSLCCVVLVRISELRTLKSPGPLPACFALLFNRFWNVIGPEHSMRQLCFFGLVVLLVVRPSEFLSTLRECGSI